MAEKSKAKTIFVRVIGWILIAVSLITIISIIAYDYFNFGEDFIALLFFIGLAIAGIKLARSGQRNSTRPNKNQIDMHKDPYAWYEAEQAKEARKKAEAEERLESELLRSVLEAADQRLQQLETESVQDEEGRTGKLIAEAGNATLISHADRGEQKNRKPMQEQDVDYSPLLELLTETQNNTYNGYVPFDQSVSVEIHYCDRDGETTSRQVGVSYIAENEYGGGGYYFSGFCHLRKEKRSFNFPRVQRTLVNGQEVDLVQHLVDTYRQSDQYKATMLEIKTDTILASDGEAGTAARVLTYIARAGGIFTRKAKVTIAQYLQEIEGTENGIEVDNYITALEQIKPTTPEYKSLVKKAKITQSLLDKAQSMIGKDPMRQGAFEILAAESKRQS